MKYIMYHSRFLSTMIHIYKERGDNMNAMSLKDIKTCIHEKYPGKFTDEEIENLPIILIDEYNTQSTTISSEKYITVKDVGEEHPYDIDYYNFPDFTRAIFITVF